MEIKEDMTKEVLEQFEQNAQEVGYFELVNQGGFVVKLGAKYSGGKRSKETGDILLGQSKKAELGNLEIPNGSLVQIHANVVWGKDKTGTQVFIYRKGSPIVARYIISGTTLDNNLGLIEVI